MPWWIAAPVALVARGLYRVRVLGGVHLPAKGGAVLIANHLSYVDVVVLQLACPRPLRFMAFRGPGTGPLLQWIFRRAGVIEVRPHQPSQWLRDGVRALRAGELICVFPEGEISRSGQLMTIRRGFELLARRAQVPVVPAAIDGLWGSVFSFSGNRYLWKWPRLRRTPVCVAFGPVISASLADPESARRALLELGVDAFAERPELKRHLGRETIRSLARRPGQVAIVDRSLGRRSVGAAQLVGAVAVLRRRLRSTVSEARVGIVLPPGAGAAIANLAVVCAGKVPVNLNFTASRSSLELSIAEAGLRTVLTADAMRARLPDFPWPERTVDLRAEITAGGGPRAVMLWMIAAWVLPNPWVAALMRIPAAGGDTEAAILFTSGSGGSPKGVVLTHRNLLANCAQISSLSVLPDSAVMLGCLPVFHSFGFTFTLWYPLLRGCRLVTSTNPLDTRALLDVVREEQVTVLLGAPTFLRPFLKKAAPGDLRSLELVVTGAEKLPEDLRLAFLQKFHLAVLQGYGLTETSPVSNLNQPDPPVTTATADPQVASKAGSVGRLLPGMSARVVDPETFADVAAGATGILLLRGANVFYRYLGDAQPGASLRDGWFVTWDLARIDEAGFVSIEGRLARFSKIGGEMVPHGAIEQKLAESLGAEAGETPSIVVIDVPDETKGEVLAVITTLSLSAAEVRAILSAAAFPNLWIPRLVRRVDAIPILGSGKLDLAACRGLAAGAVRSDDPLEERPGIIDAHIHLYAPEVGASAAAWGRAHGETAWVNCVAPEGRRSIQGWSDPAALVAEMDEAGVTACIMLGWYWERQETCDLQNAWYREWMRQYPGRLLGFAGVQPAAGRRALDSLRRALDDGFCGIGEVLPQVQGFALSDPGWGEIMTLAAERRVPVTLHATDPEAGSAAGPPTPLGDYLRLARDHPGVNLILAHWGGGLAFRPAADGDSLPPNLYFDSAASPLLYDAGVFRRALEVAGPSQILYGSDYPLILYPRTRRVPALRPFLDEISALDLTPAERRGIMGANIRGLLPRELAPAEQQV